MAQNIREKLQPDFPHSTIIAIIGGIIGLAVTVFVYFGMQRLFQHLPTWQIIEAMQGTSTTLCFAGMTSAATILPLMLTIFSFARRSNVEFDQWFYDRIKNIALLCCVAFMTGLFTLTILSAPLGDMTEVGSNWYNAFYYVAVGGIAGMVGSLIAILTLLYFAILHIIHQLNPRNLEQET